MTLTVTSNPPLSELPARHAVAYQVMLEHIRQVMNEEGPRYLSMAQDEAPKKTGEFAQNLRQEQFSLPNGAGFRVLIPTPLGRWIIDGTPAHVIAAHGRALRFQWGGEIVFFRSVNHPGTKPDNFIGRAYTAWRPDAQERLRGIATIYSKAFTKG